MKNLRKRTAVIALLATGAGQPATEPPAALVWKLESTASIGGLKPEVLGAPRRLTAAKGGPALYFDGEHDAVILPLNPVAGLARFTIEVCIRPAPGGPAEQRFFHAAGNQENRVLIETRMLDANSWCLDTYLRSGEADRALIVREKTHPAGRWTWVALVFDGRTMAHFVDGVKEAEGDVAFKPIESGRTSIGVRQNKVYWFKGAIREVQVHAVALPAEKLQKENDGGTNHGS